MGIIVIVMLVIGFIFYKFKSDWNHQRREIARQGGIKRKYKMLVDLLMEGDSRTKIYKEDLDSLELGLSVMGGYTRFQLLQTFGTLSVKYIADSNVCGKQSLDWEFQQKMDQQKMFEIICRDIHKLNENFEEKATAWLDKSLNDLKK